MTGLSYYTTHIQMMRYLSALSILFVTLINVSLATAETQLKAENAWLPEMPPVSRVMAGFVHFQNPTAKTITIVSVESSLFERVEMHLSQHVDGMARMIPQPSLIVQANGELLLQPGSYHLMLFNPKKRLLAGDKIDFTATLNNGESLTFEAEVRKSSNDQSQHHHHH